MKKFSTVFFSIYDKKMLSGEISFKHLGMDKNDFTAMCTTPDHVPPAETIEKLVVTMKLTPEEEIVFREAYEFTRKDD